MMIRGSQPPDFTPPSLQQRIAWHGYRTTIAHHEEVGVSADWHASASPSGAAAVSPPADAQGKHLHLEIRRIRAGISRGIAIKM
jgi:hypothetical protein